MTSWLVWQKMAGCSLLVDFILWRKNEKRNVCQLLKNSKQNAKQKLSTQPKFMIIIFFFNRLFEITILTKKNPFKQTLKLIKEGSKLWNSWMDIFIKWSINKNFENEGGRFFQTEQGIKAEADYVIIIARKEYSHKGGLLGPTSPFVRDRSWTFLQLQTNPILTHPAVVCQMSSYHLDWHGI